MIILDKYEGRVRQFFKSKLLVVELSKLYASNTEVDFEVRGYYAARKHIDPLFFQPNNQYFVTKFSKTKFMTDYKLRQRSSANTNREGS